MELEGKNYIVDTSVEIFFQLLKDKIRLPAENMVYHPFMNSRCDWISGKIENNSFQITDYRFKFGSFSIMGNVEEKQGFIEIYTTVKFKISILIFYLIWLSFLIVFLILVDNANDRLGILVILLLGCSHSYYTISRRIKAFYTFLENILHKNKISLKKLTWS